MSRAKGHDGPRILEDVMVDVTVAAIDDMEAIYDGIAKRARATPQGPMMASSPS